MISIPDPANGSTGRCPITGAEGPRPQPQPQPPVLQARLWPEPHGVAAEAHQYLCLLEREGVIDRATLAERTRAIEVAVARSGSYEQTATELEYGARVAWRNSSRCIGRLYWEKLAVRDLRQLTTAEEVFEALVEHLRVGTNGGKLQSTISVFAAQIPGSPGIRIWNSQLIRYAGYRRMDGTVLGDPLQVEFTELVRRLGWEGGAGTPFDILPIVIQMPGEEPRLFELPSDAVLEVTLRHPELDWFEELGLKWHALPLISNMRLEIGGVSYSAAPFNGWYMGTEIGARNLADADRYDLLPVIARCMGLDTRSNRRLWRDRALVELNVAVLHSFQEAGVTIIDHHTAAKHFVRHEEFERQLDRPLPADWSWIVPPISGSATEVFHREYHDTLLKPNYFVQAKAWEGFFPSEPHPRHQVESEQNDRDGLTGLIHRGALDRRLIRFGRQGGVLALLDLDSFTEINERYGQLVGNAFLRAAAQSVLTSVRPDDTCARFGGDAFCLLLEGIETEGDAQAVGRRVRSALSRIRLAEVPPVALKASLGMVFVEAGDNVLGAIERAIEALRSAKAEGGDRTVVVDPLHEPPVPAEGQTVAEPELLQPDATASEPMRKANEPLRVPAMPNGVHLDGHPGYSNGSSPRGSTPHWSDLLLNLFRRF